MKIFLVKTSDNKNILEQVEVPIPSPADDEILIRHEAIGINFIDYEYLRGTIPLLQSPMVPGIEAVGVIEAVGSKVKNLKKGQKVGYATVLGGAYAEYRTIKFQYVFPVPESITSQAAALNMVKGMTAHYLMRRTFFTREGMTILIHGAASNVGKLMLKLAREYKITVIATVGSDDKKQLVQELGAATAFNYNTEDFVAGTNELTQKIGVPVVYDFIGGDLLKQSMKCMIPFGLLVSAGNCLEKSHPITPASLSARSLFFTTPRLNQYKRDKPELMLSIIEICGLISSGAFPGQADKQYRFDEIPEALKDIESRKPISKVVLLG
jgi:NADPH2:quinone reductase